MKHIIHYTSYIIALVLCACNPVKTVEHQSIPTEYTSAWDERYGVCYDSIPYAVVALDLYSEGLELDSAHRMQGTGYNLYLSDVFVPDSLLAAGEYRSDTTAHPFTFLPGRDWEGTPSGMYLLYVEDSQLQSIRVLDSGSVVVRDTTNGLQDLQLTLYYKNDYGYKATYVTHFQGELRLWQKP